MTTTTKKRKTKRSFLNGNRFKKTVVFKTIDFKNDRFQKVRRSLTNIYDKLEGLLQ